jgi:hypothetical protein
MHPEQTYPSDAALIQAAKPWLSRPNIIGLTVGAKTIGGRATTDRAMVVHVIEKKARSALGPDDFPVPRQIEVHVPVAGAGAVRTVALPTDVVEVGELRTEVLDQRVRPAKGGYQIAADNLKGTGTLGVNIVWASRYRMLTTNHAISENGNLAAEIYQPDGGSGDVLGTVDGYVPVLTYPSPVVPFPAYNRQDLAWCDIDPSVGSPEIAEIGTPSGLRAPVVGEAITMIGKQSGQVRRATVSSTTLALRLEWPLPGAGAWAWFDNLIQVSSSVTQPGDSGSAYVALTDGKVVGIHIGGGAAYSFGCQLQPF